MITKRTEEHIKQLMYFVKELERQAKECDRINESYLEMAKYYLGAIEIERI